ncbi:MAG: hypothetical protein IJ513_01025 [Bacteroidaceae bacterium]|nr:hypothetical protein [Bacteroidaceae bacterium]
MSHRIAKIDIFHLPASLLKLVADHPMKVLLIDGIVRAKCCGVIVVNHCLVLVVHIVIAELFNECRDFPLKLHIKGFYDVEPTTFGLSCHNPIYICIVVHTDADRCKGINIAVAE